MSKASFPIPKRDVKKMAEKCLLITSLAILVCHPSTTNRCFKPKPSSTNSPKKRKKIHLKTKGYQNQEKDVFNSCINICDSPRFNVHKPLKLLDEIVEGNPLKIIVEDIFRFKWKHGVGYQIEKILKVNHSEKVIGNFEECKKMSMNSRSMESSNKKRVERVFYHGATVTCSLGQQEFVARMWCMQNHRPKLWNS